MDDVVLARHGESESAARGVVGGDAGLTQRGRDQARLLGERLASTPIDVCLVSPAHRTRETAELALAGRDVHGLLLRAATDEHPQPAVTGVGYGASIRLTRDALEHAAERLELWCEAPSW